MKSDIPRAGLLVVSLCGWIAVSAQASNFCLAQPQVPQGAPAAPAQASEATVVAKPVTANVNVTAAMLLNAANDGDNWLLNGRAYDNQR